MTYQQAVQQVREGKAQLHYDNGDLEGLRKLLKDAFPKDGTTLGGGYDYYYKWSRHLWGCSNHETPNLLTIKLSEIMCEVKTTKERIQAAYDKAGQEGKDILKELFPEYIKEDKSVDVTGNISCFVWQNRSYPPHVDKSFWLNPGYDWYIMEVEDGVQLIPTKK